MDEKTYTITLSDGTVIENLRLNGNNFVSDTEIIADIFTDNCSPVTINDGEVDDIHENMDLVQVTSVGDDWWFVLRDLTAEELSKIKIQSDIEYIAMMTGIEM